MRIESVVDQLGPPLPSVQINDNGETLGEITKVYHEMYAGGLSAFFENNWFYFTDHGKMTFPRDTRLVNAMASFLKALETSAAHGISPEAYLENLETRVVWELARSAYLVPQQSRASPQAVLPPWSDSYEARQRVQVVESLLGGEHLPSNPLTPPYQDKDPHRVRQFDFWYALGEFIRQRDDHSGADATKTREDCLARMRSLLDGRENRDVLYSIAVVREMTPKYAPVNISTSPQHMHETEPQNRFIVATKFVTAEAQAGGGTTNVSRKFCKIAAYAQISPGIFANRGA
ncbi:negative acting factor [Sarocladium implicatum]|jgi:hypothetical protein|nr:negative acting factor [Sarocladium implicatum]